MRGQENTIEPPLEVASKSLAHNKYSTDVSGSPEEKAMVNASRIPSDYDEFSHSCSLDSKGPDFSL